MAAPCAAIKFISFPPGAKEPVFCVDGFQFADSSTTRNYFLSHFHSDHTVGLRSSFSDGTIYCSPITGRLVRSFTEVDPKRIIDLPLGEVREIDGVNVTLVDANHCPGAVVFIFHHIASGHTVIHTGDLRAALVVQEAVQYQLKKQSISVVHEIYLDTTYASPRWDFPSQSAVLEALAETCAAEAQANPRTLFVVGSYQIGKERAAAAIARAVGSSVSTTSRRYQMLEACDWTSETVNAGDKSLLFTTDSVGCSVRLDTMMGITHDRLLSTLEHTKGGFECICAFRPTGWTFSKNWRKSKPWHDNEGRTKIFSMPYSEHSSFSELRAFVAAVRPQKMVPTVNIERSQQMVDMFAPGMDLSRDRERLDWYLLGGSSKVEQEPDIGFINVLKLSESNAASTTTGSGSSSSSSSHDGWQQPTRDSKDTLSLADSPMYPVVIHDEHTLQPQTQHQHGSSDSGKPCGATAASQIRGVDRLEDLSCVDLAAQRRQLEYYEKLTRSKEPAQKSDFGKAWSKGFPDKTKRQRSKEEPVASEGKATSTASKKQRQGAKNTTTAEEQAGNAEKRNGRFIPKPSIQVRERMDRANQHRMYLLAARVQNGRDGDVESAALDVLGSTGNVYTVTIGSQRQACTCTDFGKHPTRVCKHILFVMLRVCKLPQNDPRVWQSALTAAEAKPLLASLPSREHLASQQDDVLADSEVLRGFDMARGAAQEATQRSIEEDPDCPICFEPLAGSASVSHSVDWCRSCGHNAHKECIKMWHKAKGGNCPLCRGAWSGKGAAAPLSSEDKNGAPLNLAAFTSVAMPSLQDLYPETHQWIGSPGRRRPSTASPGSTPRNAARREPASTNRQGARSRSQRSGEAAVVLEVETENVLGEAQSVEMAFAVDRQDGPPRDPEVTTLAAPPAHAEHRRQEIKAWPSGFCRRGSVLNTQLAGSDMVVDLDE